MSQPDHFTLLGVEKSVQINDSVLSRNYLSLQQQFHPDRFVGKPEAEMQEAFRRSSEINEAYSILKNKFKRVEYLIEISGKNKLEAPQDLLMEIMELRESYEEDPQATVDAVKKEMDILFNSLDSSDIEEMTKKYVKIKYLKKFLEDAATNT